MREERRRKADAKILCSPDRNKCSSLLLRHSRAITKRARERETDRERETGTESDRERERTDRHIDTVSEGTVSERVHLTN